MKITKQNPLLGAHMSIAGGVQNALLEGERIHCTAIQLFTANNRQWSFNAINDADVAAFLTLKKQSSIQATVSHACYLINVGSFDTVIAQKSVKALEAELARCQQLEIPYAVMHPGAHVGSGEEACMREIAKNIDLVLEKMGGACQILLENTAGQGSNVGYTFEQLAFIRSQIHHKQWVGVCVDTCHAFAAGYDFTTEDGYTKMWKEFDKTVGLENLRALHLNDSKKGIGSRVDRHEHIGQGAIGLQAFAYIMNDDRFIEIPKILETPKEKDLQDDIRNIATLKGLIL